jgi:RNA polymerase sigma-70 factor (ECF subfamily)
MGGDRSAFTRLMEHYQGACYGLAWRLLGDRDLAADATQDAFIHAYDHLASFRGGAFRSWLMRITANAAYDILRRAQRRPTTTLPDPEEGEPDIPDPFAVNPVAESARTELYRALDAALRLLPEEQRTVVVLADVYGMDYQEVSVMIQSPVGTVKSRIHRGRLRLRELLADQRELFEG